MQPLTFNLSPTSLTELISALCYLNNYQAIINGSANPETQAQFARRMGIAYFTARIMEYRAIQANLSAQSTVDKTVPNIT